MYLNKSYSFFTLSSGQSKCLHFRIRLVNNKWSNHAFLLNSLFLLCLVLVRPLYCVCLSMLLGPCYLLFVQFVHFTMPKTNCTLYNRMYTLRCSLVFIWKLFTLKCSMCSHSFFTLRSTHFREVLFTFAHTHTLYSDLEF